MVKDKELGLCGSLTSPQFGRAIPHGTYSPHIDFKPSDDYIYMMVDLRKTILKTPEDVADLKAEIDIAALLDQESNLVELYQLIRKKLICYVTGRCYYVLLPRLTKT